MGLSSWLKRKLFTISGDKISDLIDVRFNEFLMKPVGLAVVLREGTGARGAAWAYACAAYLALALATEAEALRRSAGDLHRVTVNACVMLIVAMAIFKTLGVLLPRARLAALLRRLRAAFPPATHPQHLEVLRGAAVHVRAITLTFGVMSLCLIVMWQLMPLVQTWLQRRHAAAAADAAEAEARALNQTLPERPPPPERLFPMIAWYPFDPQQDLRLFVAAYLYQNGCAVIYGCVHIGVDTFYLSYIIYISAHLQVVALRFRHLQRDALLQLDRAAPGDNMKTEENEKLISKEDKYFPQNDLDKTMYNLFVQNVKYHQDIITFVRDLEALISPVMLIQFMISAVIICLSGFQATVTVDDITLVLKFMVYLATAAFQLVLYCWYGQMLIDQSLGVQWAAYSADWADASPQLKRALRIVMLRAQRPISLASAKIYVLSLDTFVKVLNTSYSFFAVLRQVNEAPSIGDGDQHHELT